MRAYKAGGRHNPSGSLRTSQPSTTKLSDSDKRMGSLMSKPESPEGDEYVEFELPADGTGNSRSVRPASGQAKQIIGNLSRLGKGVHGSHESQTTKRTQSQAGIGGEDDESRSIFKRQRTEDTTVPQPSGPGSAHGNPIRQAVRPIIPPPVIQIGPRPAPQPIVQTQVLPTAPTLVITPNMQAQIGLAEALRMTNSITPFQPDKISELFQHLCRSQLWQLLRLEEQRVQCLMNMHAFTPATPGAGSVASAGAAFTPITPVAQGSPLRNPEPITQSPVPIAQTTSTTSGRKASKVDELLLPNSPNPPLPHYALDLLSSLPEATQRSMQEPAEKIKKLFDFNVSDPVNNKKMTVFLGYLVEIASHGGLSHLDGELDGILQSLLESYLKSRNNFLSKKRATAKSGTKNNLSDIDPVSGYVLRSLPKYPQFTRMLGIAINKLTQSQRINLSISRKFNYVLKLMHDRRSQSLTEVEFKKRLDKIVGDVSAPMPSSSTTTTSTTSSTPTSATSKRREDDSDEVSVDTI